MLDVVMHTQPRKLLPILTALACVAAAAADDEEAPAAPSESAWNVTVEHDDSRTGGEERTETMRMRVFDDVGRYHDDDYRRRRQGIVLDVETVMVTCPDGYTRIEAMDVGGKDFDIEGECARANASKITVDGWINPAQADESTAERAAE